VVVPEGEYVPAEQTKHDVAPGVLIWFPGQFKHVVEPGVTPYWPIGHNEHEAAAYIFEY
jgi:hypothetical protein